MSENADIFEKLAEILSLTKKHPTLWEGAKICNLCGITNTNNEDYDSDYPEGFAKAWSEAMKDFDYSPNSVDKKIAKIMKETFVGENGEYAWK